MAILQNRLSTTPVVADYIDPSGRDHTLNEDWEAGPIAVTDTSEGLAYQAWKLTYSEEAGYNPAIMDYDGVTGYYNKASGFTVSGNKVTMVLRFNIPAFTGNKFTYIASIYAGGQQRLSLFGFSSDYAADPTRASKLQFYVRNGAGTTDLLKLISIDTVLDGNDHLCFFSFDADTAASTFFIDGVDADDTGHAARVTPITGTLGTSSPQAAVSSYYNGNSKNGGSIGYFGYRDAYLTNWTDFMTGSIPKELDEVGWTEWGAQPLFWNDEGEMEINKGSAGNMTKNGTITKVFFPEGGTFTITPETVGDPVVVLSGVTSSQQCTLAFDQNGRPTIAWEDLNQQGYLYWYDTVAAEFVTTAFQQPVTGIALTLDDKRIRQSGANDILLFYTQPNQDTTYTLYHRRQRDRYGVTYELQNPSWPYIHKCGMHEELRVQLTLSTDPPA